MHPLPDPLGPLKPQQYNPLKTLLGPPDFGLRDLWLSESYHPRHADKIGFRLRFCNASFNSAGAPVPLINSTLPREAWTMNVHAVEGAEEDSYRFNPWRGEPRDCSATAGCSGARRRIYH